MATAKSENLLGKTLRFKFKDGAMAGKSFDHVFRDDGTVEWGTEGGKKTKAGDAALVRIGGDDFVASYLGAKGFTLTAAFDVGSGKLVAFASDGKSWSKQQGTMEVV
jgi:hypothetical protein